MNTTIYQKSLIKKTKKKLKKIGSADSNKIILNNKIWLLY